MSRNGTHPIGIVVGKIRVNGTCEVKDLKMEAQTVSHKSYMLYNVGDKGTIATLSSS